MNAKKQQSQRYAVRHKYSIFHGHMQSMLGRHVFYCCECSSVLPNNAFSVILTDRLCKNGYTQDNYNHAIYIMKLIMIKRCIFESSSYHCE